MSFENYKKGEKDRDGKLIKEVFSRSAGKYIIYNCEDKPDICFEGTDEACKNYSKISPQISEIEILTYNDIEKYKFINEQLVSAIRNAADGNIETSNKILLKLENRILNLQRQKGRVHYLLGCISVFTLMLLGVFAKRIFSINTSIEFDNVYIMCILGSLGGILSESIKVKDIQIESESGFFNNLFLGALRIIIAIICSCFAYYAIKSEILLSFLNKSSSQYAMYVTAMVAGFSERFIPSFMIEIASKENPLSNKSNILG